MKTNKQQIVTSGNDSVVASDFVRSTKRGLCFKIQTKDWLLLQALIWILNHVRALAWANGRGESVTSGSGTRQTRKISAPH